MAKDWSIEENTAIVKDYFDMLKQELSSEKYNKSAHRRNLQKLLNNRSETSIEFKHHNISAVLVELGLPYISGYKPLPNYQQLLKETIEDYLISNPELEDLFKQCLLDEIKAPEFQDVLNSQVEIPEISLQVSESSSDNHYGTKRNYYKEELRNKRLGLLGEEFIISYERKRLISLGKKDLADNVEHISQTQGDSAGFDILSFDENKNEKFIEVKTTQLGKESPFYFTRNELSLSKEKSDSYSLYRVFNFKSKPKFYQLRGSLDTNCQHISTEYMGWPK